MFHSLCEFIDDPSTPDYKLAGPIALTKPSRSRRSAVLSAPRSWACSTACSDDNRARRRPRAAREHHCQPRRVLKRAGLVQIVEDRRCRRFRSVSRRTRTMFSVGVERTPESDELPLDFQRLRSRRSRVVEDHDDGKVLGFIQHTASKAQAATSEGVWQDFVARLDQLPQSGGAVYELTVSVCATTIQPYRAAATKTRSLAGDRESFPAAGSRRATSSKRERRLTSLRGPLSRAPSCDSSARDRAPSTVEG